MRIYDGAWRTTVALAAAVSAAAGVRVLGWAAMVAALALAAALGVICGWSWSEEHRSTVTRQWTAWFAIGTVLLVGLPYVIGAWAVAVIALLAAGHPVVIEHGVQQLRGDRPVPPVDPAERSGQDLARRWRRSGELLAQPDLPAAAALRLVQERAALLDEIERRDPAAFAARLVRTGWASPEPHSSGSSGRDAGPQT